MKTYFITYKQNNLLKKANVNESRYSELRADPTVSDVIVYPSELLMENNYNQMNTGDGGNRQILYS